MVDDPSDGGGDGRLEDTNCPDLLRALSKEKFTGMLELSGPRVPGRIWMVEGTLFDAEYGRLGSYGALHALVRLAEGAYAFEPHAPAEGEAAAFEEPLEALLDEALHRAEKANLLRSRLPGPDERLVVDLDHPHLYRMGIDVTGLAEVFVHGATVEDALVQSPLGEVETLQILLIMFRAGVLSKGAEASGTAGAITVSLDDSPAPRKRASRREPSLGRRTPDATRSGASRFAALAVTVLLAAGLGGALAWSSGAFAPGEGSTGEAAMPVAPGPEGTRAAGITTAEAEGGVETPSAAGDTDAALDDTAEADDAQGGETGLGDTEGAGPSSVEGEAGTESGAEPAREDAEPDPAANADDDQGTDDGQASDAAEDEAPAGPTDEPPTPAVATPAEEGSTGASEPALP